MPMDATNWSSGLFENIYREKATSCVSTLQLDISLLYGK